jgi:hypothetical protein
VLQNIDAVRSRMTRLDCQLLQTIAATEWHQIIVRYVKDYICYVYLLFLDNYRPEEYIKFGIAV